MTGSMFLMNMVMLLGTFPVIYVQTIYGPNALQLFPPSSQYFFFQLNFNSNHLGKASSHSKFSSSLFHSFLAKLKISFFLENSLKFFYTQKIHRFVHTRTHMHTHCARDKKYLKKIISSINNYHHTLRSSPISDNVPSHPQ